MNFLVLLCPSCSSGLVVVCAELCCDVGSAVAVFCCSCLCRHEGAVVYIQFCWCEAAGVIRCGVGEVQEAYSVAVAVEGGVVEEHLSGRMIGNDRQHIARITG